MRRILIENARRTSSQKRARVIESVDIDLIPATPVSRHSDLPGTGRGLEPHRGPRCAVRPGLPHNRPPPAARPGLVPANHMPAGGHRTRTRPAAAPEPPDTTALAAVLCAPVPTAPVAIAPVPSTAGPSARVRAMSNTLPDDAQPRSTSASSPRFHGALVSVNRSGLDPGAATDGAASPARTGSPRAASCVTIRTGSAPGESTARRGIFVGTCARRRYTTGSDALSRHRRRRPRPARGEDNIDDRITAILMRRSWGHTPQRVAGSIFLTGELVF